MSLEPPPQVNVFNWIWQKWLLSIYQRITGDFEVEGDLTVEGDITASNASTPTVRVTDETNTVSNRMYADDTKGTIGTSTTHPVEIETNATTAITIDTSQGVTFAGDVIVDSVVQPVTAIVEITDWNMDSTLAKVVAHGLTTSEIRSVQVMIRNDSGTTLSPIEMGGTAEIGGSNIQMLRDAAGKFDSTAYDSVSGYVRGWATITYVP